MHSWFPLEVALAPSDEQEGAFPWHQDETKNSCNVPSGNMLQGVGFALREVRETVEKTPSLRRRVADEAVQVHHFKTQLTQTFPCVHKNSKPWTPFERQIVERLKNRLRSAQWQSQGIPFSRLRPTSFLRRLSSKQAALSRSLKIFPLL